MSMPEIPELLTAIRSILNQARTQLQQTVNHTMVQTYWNVGRLIVEHEQKGKNRADYGQQQIKVLSEQLRKEFGKGFNERNLRRMRSFYLLYPIWPTVSAKLSWSHYCELLRVENQKAREWYMREAIDHAWSVRALDRQIDKLYYERLLSSKEKQPVIDEANAHIEPLKTILRIIYVILIFWNF
ncbi:DUF1016 N-terminal domain-containing protein [Legionella tunisiensis]|uniref:DUF1016 N-terminal domain-containing protein n=1 Tax=Legionella tunisiensis TaxID=1034944 RepID=UPI000315843E|nr:DUF1016 N-terminal domain-containing protein [Legionella tunisiensis]